MATKIELSALVQARMKDAAMELGALAKAGESLAKAESKFDGSRRASVMEAIAEQIGGIWPPARALAADGKAWDGVTLMPSDLADNAPVVDGDRVAAIKQAARTFFADSFKSNPETAKRVINRWFAWAVKAGAWVVEKGIPDESEIAAMRVNEHVATLMARKAGKPLQMIMLDAAKIVAIAKHWAQLVDLALELEARERAADLKRIEDRDMSRQRRESAAVLDTVKAEMTAKIVATVDDPALRQRLIDAL